MKVVIEIKNGVAFRISSDEPPDVNIIDWDTKGMDKESLIKYAHEIIVPVIEKGVLRLGFYNYPLGSWQVEGRIGNIQVTSWFDLPANNQIVVL